MATILLIAQLFAKYYKKKHVSENRKIFAKVSTNPSTIRLGIGFLRRSNKLLLHPADRKFPKTFTSIVPVKNLLSLEVTFDNCFRTGHILLTIKDKAVYQFHDGEVLPKNL